MERTNALAELATMLEKIHIRYDLWPGHATAIHKAQRIVAELAKVERNIAIVELCRAIAEEGAGDGTAC